MNDLKAMQELFTKQAARKKLEGWNKLSPCRIEQNSETGNKTLYPSGLEVGFVFTKQGSLIGAFNFKD